MDILGNLMPGPQMNLRTRYAALMFLRLPWKREYHRHKSNLDLFVKLIRLPIQLLLI